MVANCNYARTDYTMEAGALAIVPRSHALGCRPVQPLCHRIRRR
jgi:ectoine hydroxylase-related dioxygenase (phytanoyl-CoA dioxygenase family)